MDRAQAEAVAKVLAAAVDKGVERLPDEQVETWNAWARGKPVVGAFRVTSEDTELHLLLVQWSPRRSEQYHLVVFGDPRRTPLMELHRLGRNGLHWRYQPKKQDGRNPERKARFKELQGAVDQDVPVPDAAEDVPSFIERLSEIVAARQAADGLGAADAEAPPAGWIFQANPSYFDLRAALGVLTELTWQANQHRDRIEAGQPVFLWLSGRGGGMLARGEVTAAPEVLPPHPAEVPFDKGEAEGTERLRCRVRVDEVYDPALDREALRAHPDLVDLSILRNPRGTNFPVTEAELAAIQSLASGEPPPRIVKVAPGGGARFWDVCFAGDFACVEGWDALGDLSAFDDEAAFQAAFQEAYAPRPDPDEAATAKRATELWTFRELEPGDIVIANRGTTEVLAVGEVIEPGYAFRDDRGEAKHTVTVKWDASKACQIPKQAYWANVTVADVPAELYRAILAGPKAPAAKREKPKREQADHEDTTPVTFEDIAGVLRDDGLSYSDETLAAYLLGLEAKRFVLLTGISGTGKTQLALSVAKALGGGVAHEAADDGIPSDAAELLVQPYMPRYDRFIVPKRVFDRMELGRGYEKETRTELEVEYPGGRERLPLVSYKNSATYVFFRAAFKDWFKENLEPGDTFYLEIVPSDDADAPDGLRLHVPAHGVPQAAHDPRYLVIAVRPDWTDNRGLLGYFNPVLEQYVATDLLQLLLRADAECKRARKEDRAPEPYFVILDEMNLARVEHYFSDFLSSLESGEPLQLHDDDGVASGEKSDAGAIPKHLAVPANVYFTGTVNVDETTYMFSPKVLDRAFTLELNLVDLEAFGATRLAGETGADGGLGRVDLPHPFHTARPPTSEDWEAFGALEQGRLRRSVLDLHGILAEDNRHFGYRVANEIARFLVLADGQGPDDEGHREAALDLAVLLKVLPKLHGTQQELEGLLGRLFEFAITGEPPADGAGRAMMDQDWEVRGDRLEFTGDDENAVAPMLPRSAAKLWRMQRRLSRQGFTSFIE